MKSILANTRLCVCILLLILFSISSTLPQSAFPKQLTVIVKKVNKRVVYEIDSKEVTDLLRVFNVAAHGSDADQPINIFVDTRLTFQDMGDVENIADKAQVRNLRFFVFNKKTERMAELKWGEDVPFTINPDSLK